MSLRRLLSLPALVLALTVPTLAATYGTPLYVYSQRTLLHHLSQLQ